MATTMGCSSPVLCEDGAKFCSTAVNDGNSFKLCNIEGDDYKL
jgi:hypothetical protein